MQDLNEAGGISAVMKELTKLGIIHTEAKTVTGTIGERIAQADIERPDVIHSVDNAYMNRGGIAILSGNLAPDGAVIKESAVEPDLLVYQRHGQVLRLGRRSHRSDYWRRHQGRKRRGHPLRRAEGRPGDAGNAQPDGSYYGMGLKVALITDGRFSGAKAAVRASDTHFAGSDGRGPIALIEDGDMISSTFRTASWSCWSATKSWRPARRPEATGTEGQDGYLSRYARLVTSANTGAVLK